MAKREMKRKTQKDDKADANRLNKAEREELSRALEQSRGKRISQTTIGGKRHGMIKRSNKFIRDARGTMVLAEPDGKKVIKNFLPNGL